MIRVRSGGATRSISFVLAATWDSTFVDREESKLRTPTKSRVGLVCLILVWLLASGSGFVMMGAGAARPGGSGLTGKRWPSGTSISLDSQRPTLLIFLHPRCPCSRASLAELAKVEARCRGRFSNLAVLARPLDFPDGQGRQPWEADARAIASLRVIDDFGGRETERFGVETSGHVLLFEAGGRLLYGGGITSSRGHQGDNPGVEAVVALINGETGSRSFGPVFGCPLLGQTPTAAREVRP